MQANKTVEINGRLYDAVTGLPVKTVPPASEKGSGASRKLVSPEVVKQRAATMVAGSIHTQPQRSQTLHRRATKKPGPTIAKRPQSGKHMDFARSAKVARFAPHPVAVTKPVSKETPDIAPKPHPMAQRVTAKSTAAKLVAAAPMSAKQIKDTAIAKALATPTAKPAKKNRGFKLSRRFTVVTGIFTVLIIGAYLTYTNIPSLSVGFAAAQSGINATYPEYQPDGYRLSQPVTYSDGEVTLSFVSNSGTSEYTIIQTRSSWDSSAVLDNVVKPAAGDNYVTTQERGLTIYSYKNSSTWVNGGILYMINADAPLSGEQIRNIAASL